MRKKLPLVILILLLLSLTVTVAADAYVTQQIESKIVYLDENVKDEASMLLSWKEIVTGRLSDAVFSLAIFAVGLFVVWKIGPQKQPRKHISQKEALQIAAEMEAEYRKTGVYVAPSEDAAEDAIVTELEVPMMKSVDFGNHCVTVTWHPVKNADGYAVWRKAGSQRWVRVARLRGNDCTYSDYHLDADTRYAYAVKAFAFVDGSQIVSKKDPLGVEVYVTEGNIPDVPKISKRLDEEGRECLTWTKVDNIKVYRIMRKAEGGEWEFLTRVAPSAPRIFRDETAQPGTTCYYSVSAHRLFDSHVVSSDFDEDGIALKA